MTPGSHCVRLCASGPDAVARFIQGIRLELIRDGGGEVPPDTVARNNDTVADLISRHPGRLYGLATVDAYGGDAAALLALLEAGIFEELPDLRVVATALALGGVFLAGCFGDGARLRQDDPARRPVYIDTTGMHPVMIRGAVELLGADRVVMGTDWPVVKEASLAQRLPAPLAACGLDATEQRMVAGGNALRLLGRS